jgi:hypothetical protein
MPWQLTGNAGTNPVTNFLGTTDNRPLVIKVNNAERLRLEAAVALVRGNLTVGAGSNGVVKARHIEGKHWQNDNDDALYLNWASGQTVAIGQPTQRSSLTVAGDLTVGAGSNGVMKVRHIEGKNWQNDNDDALYLNWISGQSVVIGEATRPASLEVTGDIVLSGSDFAEEFDVVGPETADPGTVVVLDREGAIRVSDSAYDSRVVGVISGAGDYKPAVVMDHHNEGLVCRRPVALMGKVYCKVDASYGPVGIGNLLTTSSTPGHAMKANDRAKAFGSIIGKALRPLPAGRDLVPILIALK